MTPRRRSTDQAKPRYRTAVIASVAVLAIALMCAADYWAIKTVQDSRHDAAVIVCREQNKRHDNTISTLDTLIAEGRSDPANRKSTVLLIEALAPKRDCEKRARELTR